MITAGAPVALEPDGARGVPPIPSRFFVCESRPENSTTCVQWSDRAFAAVSKNLTFLLRFYMRSRRHPSRSGRRFVDGSAMECHDVSPDNWWRFFDRHTTSLGVRDVRDVRNHVSSMRTEGPPTWVQQVLVSPPVTGLTAE